MEMGTLKYWPSDWSAEEAREMSVGAEEKEERTEDAEVGPVETGPAASTGRASMTASEEFELLEEALKGEAPETRQKLLEKLVNEMWRAQAMGEGDDEMERVLEVPDTYDKVKRTDVMREKYGRARRAESAAMEEEVRRGIAVETKEVRGGGDFFGEFSATLNSIEVKFARENPAGMGMEGDEEEFEEALRKPIEQAAITPDQRKRLEDLLREYYDVFRLGSALTPVMEYKVDLQLKDPNVKPIFVRPRRIAPALLEKAHAHFDTLLSKGVVEPADSPWAFALVVAPKRCGETGLMTDVRYCLNYAPLNALLVPINHDFDSIEVALDNVHGAKFTSALDAVSGFHQVGLSDQASQLTAFLLPGRGQLRYKCLPFGIASGPSIFCKLMDTILEGIKGRNVAVVMDDILLHSDTFDQHLELLRSILARCRKFGLSLKGRKCQFMAENTVFCGHTVNKGKLGRMQDKVEAITSWPTPRTGSDIKSFVGLCGFYRRFTEGFSVIAQPMTSVENNFRWGEEQQHAFDELKKRLAEKTLLVRPDWKAPFILSTDWCQVGFGACLSQIQEGVEQPICFHSKVLRGAQTNYSATVGELAAVLYGVDKCREYLYGRKFTLVTDHKALLYILDNRKAEPTDTRNDIIQRWAMKLMAYDFDVEFRAGKKHVVADGLSRRTRQDLREEQEQSVGAMEIDERDELPYMTEKDRNALDDWSELVEEIGRNTKGGAERAANEEAAFAKYHELEWSSRKGARAESEGAGEEARILQGMGRLALTQRGAMAEERLGACEEKEEKILLWEVGMKQQARAAFRDAGCRMERVIRGQGGIKRALAWTGEQKRYDTVIVDAPTGTDSGWEAEMEEGLQKARKEGIHTIAIVVDLSGERVSYEWLGRVRGTTEKEGSKETGGSWE